MEEKLLYGLIGFPLEHSWSAKYFNDKFRKAGLANREYRLFPLKDISEFPGLLRDNPGLAGLNVTIPYKEKIIPFLTELEATAREIGAVNTIRINRDGNTFRTTGYNTDAPGFLDTLPADLPSGPALVLGTGGSSRAVAWALKMKGITCTLVSRSRTGHGIITYADITGQVMKDHLFIINTTPLGMYPDTDTCPPIPYRQLTPLHFLYDLVYNPAETLFLRQGRSMQAETCNGMRMLVRQAELAARIFPGMA